MSPRCHGVEVSARCPRVQVSRLNLMAVASPPPVADSVLVLVGVLHILRLQVSAPPQLLLSSTSAPPPSSSPTCLSCSSSSPLLSLIAVASQPSVADGVLVWVGVLHILRLQVSALPQLHLKSTSSVISYTFILSFFITSVEFDSCGLPTSCGR